MKKCKLTLALVLSLFITNLMGQEYTSPFTHSLMSEKVYDLIVGESSGDRAYYYIMDIAPYERDRKSSDYKGLFMESVYVVDKLKEAGFEDARTELVGKSKTWDGVSAEVWEVSPKTAKLADYRDLAAVLGQGSQNADVTAEPEVLSFAPNFTYPSNRWAQRIISSAFSSEPLITHVGTSMLVSSFVASTFAFTVIFSPARSLSRRA